MIRRYKFGSYAKRGVVAIEVAIGFLLFWTMCIFIVEIGYISYVSAMGDVMISEATHKSKLVNDKSNQNSFIQEFKKVLESNDSLWSKLVDKDGFKYSIHYVDSYDDLSKINSPCVPPQGQSSSECNKPQGGDMAPIAIYRVSYEYDPIFSLLKINKQVFSREMIVVQEYQRSKFNVAE